MPEKLKHWPTFNSYVKHSLSHRSEILCYKTQNPGRHQAAIRFEWQLTKQLKRTFSVTPAVCSFGTNQIQKPWRSKWSAGLLLEQVIIKFLQRLCQAWSHSTHTEPTCYETWTSQEAEPLPARPHCGYLHPCSMNHKWFINGPCAEVQVESYECEICRSIEGGERSKRGRSVRNWLETFSKSKGRKQNVFLEIFRIPNLLVQMLFMCCDFICVSVWSAPLYTQRFVAKTFSGKRCFPQKTS